MRNKQFFTPLLILTLTLVTLLPWGTAQAATITVNTAKDELDGGAGNGVCSLREAISNANNNNNAQADCAAGTAALDTITFDAATDGTAIVLGGAAGEDANANGDLDILDGGDLTIQGNGEANTILDGGGIDRVFHVCPGGGCANTVTFNGVTIRYGSADFGGGILNLGATLNVQDSTIGGAGAGNTATDEGGGIDNQAGTTTLDGTTVSANRATYGGGICNHAALNVQNSSTIGGAGASNTADYGGGIHNYGGTTTVEGSTVISNTAPDGGGIYNYAGSTMVKASTVISNTATDDGGGIYIRNGTATVDASTVSANIAGDDGGGIYNRATLDVQNGSTIGGVGAGNTATYNGGGIHNIDGQTTVDGSTISGNEAENGAGIYNKATTVLPLKASGVGNTVTGATSILASATLRVQNGSTIGGAGAGNTATSYGGGIYNGIGGTTMVDSSTISANTAHNGGGIDNEATLNVTNSTIGGAGGGNTAISTGGGIHNWFGTTTVEGSTISANTAAIYGGGIYNGYGTMTVDSSTISANTAHSGGGIYNEATLNVTDSTIGGAGAGNTATFTGGGIHNSLGTTTLDGCTVSANTAKLGGGIYNFVEEMATSDTGGILAQATLTVQNSAIGGAGAGNTATTAGGGIYNGTEFSMQVVGSRILHNTAPNGGGVFSWNELVGGTSVTGSCIVGNSDTSFFNDKAAEQTATGNWWGAVGGPGAPGADTVGGTVDTSDSLNTPILGCAPDLQVDKANNTGGVGPPGTPFNWTLTVANTGVMDAVFYAGQRILDDDLPAGPTYGAPAAGNLVDVTNSVNIRCSIASDTLTCEATGANVTIGAATGRFDVVLPVTPNTSGVLTNPAGNCRVDPDGNVTESDEGNNNCPANTVNIRELRVYLPLVLRQSP